MELAQRPCTLPHVRSFLLFLVVVELAGDTRVGRPCSPLPPSARTPAVAPACRAHGRGLLPTRADFFSLARSGPLLQLVPMAAAVLPRSLTYARCSSLAMPRRSLSFLPCSDCAALLSRLACSGSEVGRFGVKLPLHPGF
uniref:Secreted protein n=1 Tax=Zea mays TaxID=4577 RepID=B4FIE1_MAIZE|nr:unknown [Zea mays]|eukprot:NP_001132860.1 uncharacterized protein LOC100194353 precursor [Zea mays]